jgi:hypothetical protein
MNSWMVELLEDQIRYHVLTAATAWFPTGIRRRWPGGSDRPLFEVIEELARMPAERRQDAIAPLHYCRNSSVSNLRAAGNFIP